MRFSISFVLSFLGIDVLGFGFVIFLFDELVAIAPFDREPEPPVNL
jgi:hypothetical protein